MLKTSISLQVFVTNKVLATNKINNIEINNKLIKKSMKLKTKKLSKN